MNSLPTVYPAQPSSWLRHGLQTLAFFIAYLLFGVLGVAASLLCLVPAALFQGACAHRLGQRLIHGLFAFFVGYLRCCGLMRLDTGELAALRKSRGLLLVANHPCLLDVVLIVSQLPEVVCLMKSGLERNIFLCGTARLAGYIRKNTGLGLVKQCRERLRQGANVLVFPEGTRSLPGQLHPFKRGFALIASLAQAPVQTILISTESNFLGKGWPFFKMPPFPQCYSLRLGKRFEPEPGMDINRLGEAVENYFRVACVENPDASDALRP